MFGNPQRYWQTGGPPDKPVILFDYTTSRAQEVPLRLLDGHRGHLMTDDYAGYNAVAAQDGIERLVRWAHGSPTPSRARSARTPMSTSTGWVCPMARPERSCRAVSAMTAPTRPSALSGTLTDHALGAGLEAGVGADDVLEGAQDAQVGHAVFQGGAGDPAGAHGGGSSGTSTEAVVHPADLGRCAATPCTRGVHRRRTGPRRVSTSARSAADRQAVAW